MFYHLIQILSEKPMHWVHGLGTIESVLDRVLYSDTFKIMKTKEM